MASLELLQASSGESREERRAAWHASREWGVDAFAQHVADALGMDLTEFGHADYHVATPVTDVTTNACVRLVVQSSV